MATKFTNTEALQNCVSVHGDKYCYDNFIYTGVCNSVKIICPKHGEFSLCYSNHIRGYGCRKCNQKRILTPEVISERIKLILPNIRVIEIDPLVSKRVIVEDDNLIRYSVETGWLLKGSSPTIETAIDKNKAFEILSKKIHGDRYDYSLVRYIDAVTKVSLICPDHGVFKTRPTIHLRGSICKKCNSLKLSALKGLNNSGWTCSSWIESSKTSKKFDSYKLYIILCSNNIDESFIKIGRTFNKIKERFYGTTALPYEFIVLNDVSGDARYIYELENKIKLSLNKYKYIPKIEFGGKHECFGIESLKILKNKIWQH